MEYKAKAEYYFKPVIFRIDKYILFEKEIKDGKKMLKLFRRPVEKELKTKDDVSEQINLLAELMYDHFGITSTEDVYFETWQISQKTKNIRELDQIYYLLVKKLHGMSKYMSNKYQWVKYDKVLKSKKIYWWDNLILKSPTIKRIIKTRDIKADRLFYETLILLKKACRLDRPSASFVQRHLRITWDRASKIIQQLIDVGYVTDNNKI